MKRYIRFALAAFAIGAVASAQPLPLQPQRPAETDTRQAATAQLTRDDLETWMSGFMPQALRKAQVPGAVIVIVKDGQLLFSKGYGHADAAGKIPVDPNRTVFRPGSISKLFAATAVMQLVEAGKLNLDEDINTYLDFKIPDRFGAPIRLRHLLSHSAGFEDVLKDLVTFDPAQAQSLEHYVKGHVPARLYPPGEIPGYSNYGIALAGYIVQRTSGEPFETYVEHNIFRPLGMGSSTFRQPLPSPLKPHMAKGYAGTASDGIVPFEIFGPMPAGGLSSTGSDMARFMVANLQNGRFGHSLILQPATLRQMHARNFAPFAQLNGLGLGFWQHDRNGRRIVGHDGGTPGFRSNVRLFVDEGVGLFMSFNGTGKDGGVFTLRSGFLDEFTDRYLPSPRISKPTIATAAEHGRMAEGLYSSSGRSVSGFLKLLLLDQVGVTANSDGTISLSSETDMRGQLKRWKEIAPFVWQDVNGQDRLAMIVRDGRVTAIAKSADAANYLLRTPAWQSSSWNVPLFVGMILIFALTVLGWPVLALMRLYYGIASVRTSVERRAYQGSRLAALLGLAFIGTWLFLFMKMGAGRVDLLTSGFDPILRSIQFLGVVAIVATGAIFWNAWCWWTKGGGWIGKIWSVLLSVAGLALIWFSFAFNLISIDLRY